MENLIVIEPIDVDLKQTNRLGIETFKKSFIGEDQTFGIVFLNQFIETEAITGITIRLKASTPILAFNIEDCGFHSDFLYTVEDVLGLGPLRSDDPNQNGRWVLYKDRDDGLISLSVVLDDQRLEFFPTPFETDTPVARRIYAVVTSPIRDCSVSDSLELGESDESREANSDLSVPVTKGPDLGKGANNPKVHLLDPKRNKSTGPISIVVGYTNEVIEIGYTEDKIKSMLRSVEADLNQSLVNAGVNLGLSPSEEIRFEIREDVINTGVSRDTLTALESVYLLSYQADGVSTVDNCRFQKMHADRAGANLVFLLVNGVSQGHHYKEFAVIPIRDLKAGVLQHELGHMVCSMGGGISVPSHHGQEYSGGTGDCHWSTLLGTGNYYRLNCWATQNLQGSMDSGITTLNTGAKDVAKHFPLAAEFMRTLG